MHSSDTLPAPPATGPNLLLQLGRLIIRSRSTSPAARATPQAQHDRLLHAKLLAAKPSTSKQVQSQPKPAAEGTRPSLEAVLSDRVHALWSEQIPVCIEVLLAPSCAQCRASLQSAVDAPGLDSPALLLERWTMHPLLNKGEEPTFITSQWLLNAVRSQLHFSQLSAWRATTRDDDSHERRRKLSRETCNYKKLESNCDDTELPTEERKLNIVYSIKIPGANCKPADFTCPPTDHTFPVTDIGNNVYLKVVLQTLPRIDEIPTVKCTCPPKRRTSKEVPNNIYDELTGKLNDLTLGPITTKFGTPPPDLGAINSNIGTTSRRLSVISNAGSTEFLFSTQQDKDDKKVLLDDRMHTPCSENGKHKCNCDDESDGKENQRSSTSISPQETKKLDERRLKEIAKYKRRLRKEIKLNKLGDSTSSEGDNLQKTKETTSIPILQAARFDRFRAIGCYRNQTYLTLPASRIESKSPFTEAVNAPPSDMKKTCTIGTQTEEFNCPCGKPLDMKCVNCKRGMVRSEANYNLAMVDQDDNSARRKCEEEVKPFKKHKCDKSSVNVNIKCDNNSFNSSVRDDRDDVIKRPKLRRFLPIVDRIEKVVQDRFAQRDMEELHLKTDDTVFSRPKPEKRQKTFSISEDDFVLYEKCEYGTIDTCDVESPIDENNSFKFPDLMKDGLENQVPSPTEMDRFRWRFDSATSMVFHTKTGLPLTSSPAPLRRGNNCFDFDDSINGIPGIKSALFHPISPPAPSVPPSPCLTPPPASTKSPDVTRQKTTPTLPTSPLAATEPAAKKQTTPRLRMGPSGGLLGSFEESALKGRLEPVATVAGFSCEVGASGSFCPPHKRLPVTVFFYAPGGTNAPYMGHINLGAGGYRVARSGTIQVSLFNPHGTLVKMFVVLYDLTGMPPRARTFLRQRTLYLPAQHHSAPHPALVHKCLRYLIHLRFMTSKSGKLYLHTDIRILVSRKADLDTATAHSALMKPMPTNQKREEDEPTNRETNGRNASSVNSHVTDTTTNGSSRTPNRVFGGCSEYDSEFKEIGYDNQNGVSYELRSFTYAPDNPKFSPR